MAVGAVAAWRSRARVGVAGFGVGDVVGVGRGVCWRGQGLRGQPERRGADQAEARSAVRNRAGRPDRIARRRSAGGGSRGEFNWHASCTGQTDTVHARRDQTRRESKGTNLCSRISDVRDRRRTAINGGRRVTSANDDFVFPLTREARAQANRLDKFSTPRKLD